MHMEGSTNLRTVYPGDVQRTRPAVVDDTGVAAAAVVGDSTAAALAGALAGHT